MQKSSHPRGHVLPPPQAPWLHAVGMGTLQRSRCPIPHHAVQAALSAAKSTYSSFSSVQQECHPSVQLCARGMHEQLCGAGPCETGLIIFHTSANLFTPHTYTPSICLKWKAQ